MVPGEGDITEAARTVQLVAGLASAARRDIPSRVVLNRVRSSTALSKHAVTEAASLPKLKASLSDLEAYGEMGFSGRMPTGKVGTEVAALLAELRSLKWLPASRLGNASSGNSSSVNTKDVNTIGAVR
jgi:chromosome partitioning protein